LVYRGFLILLRVRFGGREDCGLTCLPAGRFPDPPVGGSEVNALFLLIPRYFCFGVAHYKKLGFIAAGKRVQPTRNTINVLVRRSVF